MEGKERVFSDAIRRSLWAAPLLVGDLPEAKAWEGIEQREGLAIPLNFEQKLGHLYEDAFEQLLVGDPCLELLARNLQVFDSTGRTLGEFDFLIHDQRSDELVHLELAVKFYMFFKSPTGEKRYPGPDPRDNWLNKLDRMRSKQLVLSRTPEARALVKKRFGREVDVVAQRVYGSIFDPIGSEARSAPPYVSEGCRRGIWLYRSEWSCHFAESERVRLIPKCLWPVEIDRSMARELDLVGPGELLKLTSERSLMVYHESKGDTLFVVPDSWPEV